MCISFQGKCIAAFKRQGLQAECGEENLQEEMRGGCAGA